jgi:hypothetical protein
LEFAVWRKTEAGGQVSGRCIDLDVRALRHALRRAVELGWLSEIPIHKWKQLAKKPDKTRLITPAELDQLCQTALPDPKIVAFIPRQHRNSGQDFADYLRLPACSGGREQETIKQRWSNVKWSENEEKGALHFPAETAKQWGGSQEAGERRDVDFNQKLEAHLKQMFERKDPKSDWMFPSQECDGPMKNFRRQLNRVKKRL